jgi:hypothetical protein
MLSMSGTKTVVQNCPSDRFWAITDTFDGPTSWFNLVFSCELVKWTEIDVLDLKRPVCQEFL